MDKTQAVRKLAEQTIETHAQMVDFLCVSLHITREEVIEAWIVWDTGINEYNNSVYNSFAMRVAMHLHNCIPGNWHDKRQKLVLELLNKIKPFNIVDIGFGTPQRYVTDYVLRNGRQLTLLDFDDESLSFVKYFLNSVYKDWEEKISLRKYNMNSNDPIGVFDCYLLQDSIEHTNNPTKYLSKLVEQAAVGSYFIFSLPIEVDKPVPEHTIFWKDNGSALKWLEVAGLTVLESHNIDMDKDLDLFAKFLHPDFRELLVLALKKS